MNTHHFAKPVCVLGNDEAARNYISKQIHENDDLLIVEKDGSIDELKKMRIFLQKIGLHRKVGIIYSLNKFSEPAQAVMLKIFEELPKENAIFFTCSYLPMFTISSRSNLIYLGQKLNPALKQASNTMLEAMKHKQLTKQMRIGFRVLVQAQALYDDGLLGIKEKEMIFNNIMEAR